MSPITFNPIIGLNYGTIAASTFYLENNIGSLVNNSSTSGTCSGTTNLTCTVGGSLLNFADIANYGNSIPSATSINFYAGHIPFSLDGKHLIANYRLLNYYKAYMDGTAIPSNSPIWELEEKDGYSRLLQLNHH